MVMNGYDTDADGENNFYTVNGRSFYYARYPIRVRRSELVRIYLANLTEFDLINSFHLHADFFRYQPTGTGDNWEYTDTVMQCQGQRGVLEIRVREHGSLHVPRAPVRVRRARLDGVLRGRRLAAMEARPRRHGDGWAGASGRSCRCCCSRSRSARSSRAARRSSTSSGRTRRRRTSSTSAASSSSPGEIRIIVRNPQPDDLTIANVNVDDAIVPYTVDGADDARPPALEHDRRPLRLGRGRSDHGRRDELDRDPDGGGDPRGDRDA